MINEDTAIWDPEEELQVELACYTTVSELLAYLLVFYKASGMAAGESKVQHEVKMALGISQDIDRALRNKD